MLISFVFVLFNRSPATMTQKKTKCSKKSHESFSLSAHQYRQDPPTPTKCGGTPRYLWKHLSPNFLQVQDIHSQRTKITMIITLGSTWVLCQLCICERTGDSILRNYTFKLKMCKTKKTKKKTNTESSTNSECPCVCRAPCESLKKPSELWFGLDLSE